MARARESESRRERRAPPPRRSGAGLQQIALFGGLLAVVFAFLGALLAGGTRDPIVERHADALGAGMVSMLTAPSPEVWDLEHGTLMGKAEDVKKGLGKDLPSIPKEQKDRILRKDFQVKNQNKERLFAALQAGQGVALMNGLVRGAMLRFNVTGIENHAAGARINPQQFPANSVRLGNDVQMARMLAGDATGTGSFEARVYYRPYKNRSGATVGAGYVILSQGVLDASGGGGGLWLFLTPLLVGLAIGFVIFQTSKATEGLQALGRDLEAIGRGKLDHRVNTAGPGDVGYVQRTAERMAKNLTLIQTTGSGDLDEAMEKERDLASQIHESLRPSDPPRIPGYELETLFKSGLDIGGDYFDYIELDAKRTALVIADCSDNLRGVPAAMIMAMTRAYLNAAIDPSLGPAEWLKSVNRRLARDLKSGMAVTCLIAIIDSETGEMTAANAGHRPIILWRLGKTAMINPNGIALGLDIGPVFDGTIEEKKFKMNKNDRIVLYTDGAISAENGEGETYGETRFTESIRKQGGMNSAAFVNFVVNGVDRFLEGAEQNDDITVSTLKRMK